MLTVYYTLSENARSMAFAKTCEMPPSSSSAILDLSSLTEEDRLLIAQFTDNSLALFIRSFTASGVIERFPLPKIPELKDIIPQLKRMKAEKDEALRTSVLARLASKSEKIASYLNTPLTSTLDKNELSLSDFSDSDLFVLDSFPEGKAAGNVFFRLSTQFSEAKEKEKAKIEKNKEITKILFGQWVTDLGSENQKRRFKECLLPQKEIFSLALDHFLKNLSKWPCYVPLSAPPCECVYDNEECVAVFEVSRAEEASSEEFEALTRLRSLLPSLPNLVATAHIYIHSASRSLCKAEDSKKAIMVFLSFHDGTIVLPRSFELNLFPIIT